VRGRRHAIAPAEIKRCVVLRAAGREGSRSAPARLRRCVRVAPYRDGMLAASSWLWGWDSLVALGTIGLAVFTAWLASTTRSAVRESRDAIKLQTREVEAVERQTAALAEQTHAVRDQAVATQRQAEVSAAALESSVRPILVGALARAVITQLNELGCAPTNLEPVTYPGDYTVPVRPLAVHYEERNDMLYLSFCVRNIGTGVAFVQRVALLTRTAYPVRISPPIVAPNETARVLVALTLKQSNGQFTDVNEITRSRRGFVKATVGIFYTGPSHDLALTTEVTLSELIDQQSWLVTGTRVWEGDTKADLGIREEGLLLASTDNIG
jgi:hypothetical protein